MRRQRSGSTKLLLDEFIVLVLRIRIRLKKMTK
jgi:hypothetical protein